MKCTKCGSELDTGFRCSKCGYKWQNGIKQPEPSTAEKLLWLAEKFDIQIKDNCGIEVLVECRKNGRWIVSFVGDEYESKTLAEAISAAYEWAIKEEK